MNYQEEYEKKSKELEQLKIVLVLAKKRIKNLEEFLNLFGELV